MRTRLLVMLRFFAFAWHLLSVKGTLVNTRGGGYCIIVKDEHSAVRFLKFLSDRKLQYSVVTKEMDEYGANIMVEIHFRFNIITFIKNV